MNFKGIIETATTLIGPILGRLQESAVQVISGPGGVLLLLIGIIGILLMAINGSRALYRLVRRAARRTAPVVSPIDRAQGLAKLGARPAEIARAVGLSRDALALAIPGEPPSGIEEPAPRKRLRRSA